MNNLTSFLKNKKTVLVAAGSAMLISGSAAAVETGVTEAINAAIAAGTNNVGLVTAGVITVAALGFGVAMVTGWLRK